MSKTGFYFYEGSTTDSATSARITVRKGGILVLTKATVEMLGADVEAVQVGFNPETRAIALRPASLDARGSYRLRGQRNSVSKLVDGKRVFKHHGLIAKSSMSYDAESFGDGLVGFTLPETAMAETENATADTKTKRRSTKAKS